MPDELAKTLPLGAIVYQRYQILAVVGRGGLGTVYQVSDILFGKRNIFALKELIDQSSGARRQFELESQWLKSLDHNNIPRVRESFEWENRLYLVMDFVDGENLEQKLIRSGGRPLPERQVIQWALPICEALNYLHSRNPPILHRDVKPSNIIVTPLGHPVLVDLGIAKEHLPGAGMTATFVRKAGTEGYAPPEQYTAAGQTGPWSDVYGTGATLYQLLTGRIPPTAVERVALDGQLIRPRAINPAVSPHIDAAIMKALSLRPVERFQTIRAFATALAAPYGMLGDVAPNANGATRAQPSSPARPAAPTPASPAPASPAPASPPRPASYPPLAPSTGPFNAPNNPAGAAPDPYSIIRKHTGLDVAPPDGQPAASRQAPPRNTTPSALPSSPPSSDAPARPSSRPSATPRYRGFPSLDGDPESAASEQHSPIHRWRLPLIISASLAILIALVVVGVTTLNGLIPPDRSSPTATANGYFAALRAKDYTRAFQFVAASRNDVGAQSVVIAGLEADEARLGPIQNVTLASPELNSGSKATLSAQVTRAQSPPMTYTLSLTQYDSNTWLIDNITIT